MTSYLLPTSASRFAFLEDEDNHEAASRMVAVIGVCPSNSVELVLLRGAPNDPRWKGPLDEVDDKLTTGAMVRMASVQEIMTRVSDLSRQARFHQRMDIESKVREMANETYVNRVKTSDKQTKAVTDFIKG